MCAKLTQCDTSDINISKGRTRNSFRDMLQPPHSDLIPFYFGVHQNKQVTELNPYVKVGLRHRHVTVSSL